MNDIDDIIWPTYGYSWFNGLKSRFEQSQWHWNSLNEEKMEILDFVGGSEHLHNTV